MRTVKRIYLFYVILLVLAAVVTLFILWGKLEGYQEDREKAAEEVEFREKEQRAPQLAFEEYARNIDTAWWAEQYIKEHEAQGKPALESREQVEAYFQEKLAGRELQRFKASDWSITHPVYVVRAEGIDDVRATIEMAGASLSWKVSDVHIEAAGDHGGEIEAPAGSVVFCNGVPLDESYITGSGEAPFPFTAYKDQLSGSTQWSTYTVDGLLAEPELTCDAEDMDFSEADQCLVKRLSGDEAARLISKSKDFLHSYLYYVTGGGGASGERIGACLNQVHRGSDAYDRIAASSSSIKWTVTYSNLEINYIAEEAPIIWADNARSVDLIYHAYASTGGGRQDYSGADLRFRVLFLNQGNGWEIYAFRTE